MVMNCEMLDVSSGVLIASKRVIVEPVGGEYSYFFNEASGGL
jgi:hypothetical protein